MGPFPTAIGLVDVGGTNLKPHVHTNVKEVKDRNERYNEIACELKLISAARWER
jgi:hypothetical protein